MRNNDLRIISFNHQQSIYAYVIIQNHYMEQKTLSDHDILFWVVIPYRSILKHKQRIQFLKGFR